MPGIWRHPRPREEPDFAVQLCSVALQCSFARTGWRPASIVHSRDGFRKTGPGEGGRSTQENDDWFGKLHTTAQLLGPQAKVQIENQRPTFYVYLDITDTIGEEAGRVQYAYSVGSGGAAYLVQLDTLADLRALNTSSGNLDSELKLKNHRVFKMTPKKAPADPGKLAITLAPDEDIPPGAYLLSFGAQTGGFYYDFGVKNSGR